MGMPSCVTIEVTACFGRWGSPWSEERVKKAKLGKKLIKHLEAYHGKFPRWAEDDGEVLWSRVYNKRRCKLYDLHTELVNISKKEDFRDVQFKVVDIIDNYHIRMYHVVNGEIVQDNTIENIFPPQENGAEVDPTWFSTNKTEA